MKFILNKHFYFTNYLSDLIFKHKIRMVWNLVLLRIDIILSALEQLKFYNDVLHDILENKLFISLFFGEFFEIFHTCKIFFEGTISFLLTNSFYNFIVIHSNQQKNLLETWWWSWFSAFRESVVGEDWGIETSFSFLLR